MLNDHTPYPFARFPVDGIPSSLVSHWTDPYNIHETGLLSLSSLKASYVMLPNSGSKFISIEEVMAELQDVPRAPIVK